MKVETFPISGVLLVTPPRFADSRGYFVETYSQRGFAAIGIDMTFRQDNQSLSTQRGTIRGLHFQLAPEPQSKLVRVLTGSVFDAAIDLREGSATYGKWCGATLTAARGETMFVPKGFAHGFCTLEPDTIIAYKVDGFYNKAAERGIRWDDPDIAVEWPLPADEIVVSERDAAMPYLRDAATPFRFTA